jgi:hypothetical protein
MNYQDAGVIPRTLGYAERASKNAVKLLVITFVIHDGYLAVWREFKNRQKKLGRRAFDLGSDDVT